MSSKMKATKKEDGKTPLVPKVRFPEFREAEGWDEKELGDLCKIQTGKKDANEGAEDGIYPFFTCAANHIYSRSYSFDAEAILVAGNANVGQTKYYYGKFEAYQRTYVLTEFLGIRVPYLYAILSATLRESLLGQVQVSAMSYIKLPMLLEFKLAVPPSIPEQQKIADCLSSLDEVIAAQARKLAALKIHKQGLMQQLFPREGETQPRLRFPEFQGNWALTSGADITSKITKGSSPSWQGFSYQKDGVLFITSENVRDGFLDVSVPKFLPEEFFAKQKNSQLLYGDILINIVGASIGRNCVFRLHQEAFTNQAVALFRVTKGHSFEFVSYCYQHDRSQKAVSASQSDSARPNLSLTDLRNMEFIMPSLLEQQRIATCLTTLDDLITAQSAKIEALKTHKKGLMQQLFPSPEEVGA